MHDQMLGRIRAARSFFKTWDAMFKVNTAKRNFISLCPPNGDPVWDKHIALIKEIQETHGDETEIKTWGWGIAVPKPAETPFPILLGRVKMMLHRVVGEHNLFNSLLTELCLALLNAKEQLLLAEQQPANSPAKASVGS